jgi:hypothetical protein
MSKIDENCSELDEDMMDETPSKKAPMESLTLTKQLTSKRSRNDFSSAVNSASLLKASRTVELPGP